MKNKHFLFFKSSLNRRFWRHRDNLESSAQKETSPLITLHFHSLMIVSPSVWRRFLQQSEKNQDTCESTAQRKA